MAIHAALSHITHYRYDRRAPLSPQAVRLPPTPHSRTKILSYSQVIEPTAHFISWQQDPFANDQARLVFPEPITEFLITHRPRDRNGHEIPRPPDAAVPRQPPEVQTRVPAPARPNA